MRKRNPGTLSERPGASAGRPPINPPSPSETYIGFGIPPPSAPPRLTVMKIVSASDLGGMIRAARKERRLSQQAFADLAGVGRRFLSELENGKPTLELDKALKVAAACGIELVARRLQT